MRKIETILRRGKYNARMKDYYDVYSFLTKLKNEINMETFKNAFNNTITQRESSKYLNDYKQILEEIAEDKRMNTYWNNYKGKNKYAKDIELNEIIKLTKDFIRDYNVN